MTLSNDYFGIIGYGYVGRGTHYGLLKKQVVTIHDTLLNTKRSDLKACKFVFICIPTENYQHIEILKKEISLLIHQNSKVQIVIRSTLPIGTSDQIEKEFGIKLIYIPEFLRERFWEEDCQNRPLIVGHNSVNLPDWLLSDDIIQCSTSEAELVKMFSNNFAVMRIAFANIFYDMSQKADANYDKVKSMYFKVAHSQTYMEVPGHDGTRGFGGKCLPKDLDFLIDSIDKEQLDSQWFKHIRDLNKEWQKKF